MWTGPHVTTRVVSHEYGTILHLPHVKVYKFTHSGTDVKLVTPTPSYPNI